MPIIKPSSDLRNNYPVYITKNGIGDNEISTICHQTKSLAVMSIELYELLTDKYMLYKELEKGINSLEKGEKYSEKEVYEELDKI